VDLDAVLAVITAKTKIVFIANPNNPTGSLIGQEKIDNFPDACAGRGYHRFG